MKFHVITDHPVAVDSPDHKTPVGTRQDNSSNPAFNRKLYQLIPAKDVRLMDVGCAGGALVKSILDDGGLAIGIEGSDYSKVRKRAEWATIPDNLFTADATKPFEVRSPLHFNHYISFLGRFNVITAWEFWEHIAERDIPAVADNVIRHLHRDGFFIGTISSLPDIQNHVVTDLHQTLQDKAWWLAKFESLGFAHAPDIEEHFGGDTVRWSSFTIALRPKH